MKRVLVIVVALLALSAMSAGIVYSCADISPCYTNMVAPPK